MTDPEACLQKWDSSGRRAFVGWTFALTCVLGVIGCGSSQPSPAAPSTHSFTGNWLGTLSSGSTATLQLRLTQSGDAMSGTWTMTGPDGSQTGAGTLDGRAFGSTMSVVLAWSPPSNCPLNVSGTLDDTGTQMTGSFGSSVCGSYYQNAGFKATRQ